MILFCSTLILVNSGLACDQRVLLPFLFERRAPTLPEKRSYFILLTEFWQLSCFITRHKLLLRDKLFFKSLILTRSTTISIVHFYSYSIISFFYCKLNITRFYICYWLLLLSFFFISFIISRCIVLKLSLVLLRKCISYKTNDRVSDVFHLPAVDHRIKRRIKELQCHSVKL